MDSNDGCNIDGRDDVMFLTAMVFTGPTNQVEFIVEVLMIVFVVVV